MTMHLSPTMKHVLTLFTVLVALTAPTKAASFSLTNDPSTGEPGKFAAEEIRREAVAHGMTLGDDAKEIGRAHV